MSNGKVTILSGREIINPQEVITQLEMLRSIIFFQTSNGILSEDDINNANINNIIAEAYKALESNDMVTASEKSGEAHIKLYSLLNKKRLRERLFHLYGFPVLVFLVLFIVFLMMEVVVDFPFNLSGIRILVFQVERAGGEIVEKGLSGKVIWWGGLGAAAYAIYHLRRNIFQFQLSKYYQVYYAAYCLAGLAFGTGAAAILAAGLLTVAAAPNEAVFFSIAFLAGLLQHWALSLLYSIAESIHKPRT